MRVGSSKRLLLGLGLLLVLCPAPGRADIEQARQFYLQARAEADPLRKIGLLEQSLGAFETFEAHLALGDAYLATKNHSQARAAVLRAYALAATEPAKATAVARSAEICLAEGARQEAIALLRQAAKAHPPALLRLKQLELEGLAQPVGAADITAALAGSGTRSFGVKPAVSLRIGFARDSAALNEGGMQQARELGQALRAAALQGRRFEILGHTDRQGADAHNEQLSQRRAEAVKAFLMREFELPEDALVAIGRGKRDLLYPGDTEQDHALNRRVEVTLR